MHRPSRLAGLLLALAAAGPVAASAPPGVQALAPVLDRALGSGVLPAGEVVSIVPGDPPVVRLSGRWPTDPVEEELLLETLMGLLDAAGYEGGVFFEVEDGSGGFRRLGGGEAPLPDLPPPHRGPPRSPAPYVLDGVAQGALAGVRIAVSAGHGWLPDGNGGYRTQRSRWKFTGCGECRGILEDFFTAELATRWVIPLLEQMGAEVIVVREPDLSLERYEVDDGDGTFVATGPWMAGSQSDGWQGDYQVLEPGAEGSATFPFLVAEPAMHRVAIRWREGSNRTSAARIVVRHAGGETFHTLDLRQMGRHWLDLGRYRFEAGAAAVVVEAAGGDGYLVADAAKLGGGVHQSGKPWWQMSAFEYVPAAGAPAGIAGLNDVVVRPTYAEWISPDLYVSLHANASGVAGGSSANGLSIYRYSCQRYGDHSPSSAAIDCDDPPGSTALIESVHTAVLRRIRSDFDPNFGDRGTRVANFGELRQLDDTPGILIETAFFDNLENPSGDPPPRYPDNRSLHDPRWREAFAYGLAEGLAAFLRPGSGAPPPRPQHLWARNREDGTLEVGWKAVPGAEAYQVQLADWDRNFGDGPRTTQTRVVFDDLVPGRPYAFRVAAIDANGRGFYSPAVVARYRGAKNMPQVTRALVVDAYDRRDAWVQEIDNDLSYSIEHGLALASIASVDVYFDGATDEAVEAGDIALSGYALVDVACGKDSTEHHSVDPPLRDLLVPYLEGGGRLLISGEEIAWHLGNTSTDANDRAFLEDALGARYVADDAETFEFSGASGTPFEGLGSLRFDDGSHVYEVRYPDVVEAAAPDARVALVYATGAPAAIARPAVLYVAFPLEAVVPLDDRRRLFEAAIAHLEVPFPTQDTDEDGAPDGCEAAFGLDPLDGADGALDPDGDGVSSAAECAAGTDPTRPEHPGGDGGLTPSPDGGAGGKQVYLVTGHWGCSGTGAPADDAGGLAALLVLGLLAYARRGPMSYRVATQRARLRSTEPASTPQGAISTMRKTRPDAKSPT